MKSMSDLKADGGKEQGTSGERQGTNGERQGTSGERQGAMGDGQAVSGKPHASRLTPHASRITSHASRLTPHASRLTPHAAFTLLEVMVAVSIMAIVLVAVYKMHAQTIAMSYASRFYTTAPLLAQRKIADLGIETSTELGGGSGDFGEDFPGYAWSMAIEEVESEVLGTIAKDLKRIDVSVNFGEGEFVYEFRTYKFIEEK